MPNEPNSPPTIQPAYQVRLQSALALAADGQRTQHSQLRREFEIACAETQEWVEANQGNPAKMMIPFHLTLAEHTALVKLDYFERTLLNQTPTPATPNPPGPIPGKT